jgi:hypothetical protein
VSPRFPTVDDVDPAVWARAKRLKDEYLSSVQPEPKPRMVEFWDRYQGIFSPDGLLRAGPAEFKAFATDRTVIAGSMTVFLRALGADPKGGTVRVRQVVEHLLRGSDPSLENRFTDLVRGNLPYSMPGFKEALLSKVLSVVFPERFLSIVTYDQKAFMAKTVYGLDLPPRDAASIGRLMVWSNDLLNELTGSGFADRPHAGEFLWWAKDQI